MTSKKKVKLFLSHSSKDKDFVESLAVKLAKDDYLVWYDDWEIKVGDSIVQKINDGISYSDFLIVVLSGSSVNSKWVKEELNAATIKNIESKGAFILPVLLEKCEIPLLLADKKYADFTKNFEKAYHYLDDAIRHHLTLISEILTDGFETDVRKTAADSIEVEASIEENWLNLLEDANEIRIKRYLTKIKADIKGCFFKIVEFDEVDTSDSIRKYYQTIDTVSILILTLVKYDLKQYRKELIDILNYTYNLIAGPNPTDIYDNPRGKQAKLWLSIITRVYLIGAVALKLSKYDIIKSLILVEPGWSDYWRTYYWSRHCLIMHARSPRSTTSNEGLVALSNSAIEEVSWAEDYFKIASKEALENLANFDLYQNITVYYHGSGLGACYPSYAQFHKRHLWKTFQDIGLKRNSYSIISDIPDSKVAKILIELDDYAGNEFSYATGWRTGSFPSELQKFIQTGLEES